MVPFQLVIIRSSPSARPYEHASRFGKLSHQHTIVTYVRSMYLPAPWPFSPFSSSSKSRKLRGIFALILVSGIQNEETEFGFARSRCNLYALKPKRGSRSARPGNSSHFGEFLPQVPPRKSTLRQRART